MAFVDVVWAFKDVIASSKLAQMVTNTREHDHRADGTQGAPDLCARVRRAATQNLTNNVFTVMTWDTEDYDRGGFYVPGQPTRLTIPVSGVYRVSGNVPMGANNTGSGRAVAIYVNGAAATSGSRYVPPFASASRVPTPEVNLELQLDAGDYLELFGWQDTGATLATFASGGIFPFLSVALVSRT